MKLIRRVPADFLSVARGNFVERPVAIWFMGARDGDIRFTQEICGKAAFRAISRRAGNLPETMTHISQTLVSGRDRGPCRRARLVGQSGAANVDIAIIGAGAAGIAAARRIAAAGKRPVILRGGRPRRRALPHRHEPFRCCPSISARTGSTCRRSIRSRSWRLHRARCLPGAAGTAAADRPPLRARGRA